MKAVKYEIVDVIGHDVIGRAAAPEEAQARALAHELLDEFVDDGWNPDRLRVARVDGGDA